MNSGELIAEAVEYRNLARDYPNGYQHLDTSDLIGMAQVNATLAVAQVLIEGVGTA